MAKEPANQATCAQSGNDQGEVSSVGPAGEEPLQVQQQLFCLVRDDQRGSEDKRANVS